MKTRLLLAICFLSCTITKAQYFFYDKNGKTITIYDMMRDYNAYEKANVHKTEKDQEELNKKHIAAGKDMDESGDYQFDRMLWYWKRHTDENGNLISQTKTWDEWNKYNGNIQKYARITGTNQSNWQFMGPDTPSGGLGLGRISAVAFHPTNPNTYWIGSDGGGAWKTTNNGATWTNMTDNLPSLIVSDVDINPINPNTVYICTGDRDSHYRIYGIFGVGVLKSYNGGLSWDTTGMNWMISQMQVANCLLINPQDTNCIILATSSGIFKSMNGGKKWVQKVGGGNFKQILYSPTDTNIIYASKFYDPSIGASGQILRSTDGGETWTQVTSFVKVCRVALAVSPANPKIVKALTSSSDSSGNLYGIEGVYSSNDTGHHFTEVYSGSCFNNILDWSSSSSHSCGGQGWYDLTIAVDPANATRVYIGGINSWASTDGGASWNILTQWDGSAGAGSGVPVVHADKHVAIFHPLVTGRFFECNDGGIFYSDNIFSGFSTWNDITTGLGITEFYSNAVSDNCVGVIGGAQDNGSMLLYDHAMGALTGGDGVQCQEDPLDSNTLYTSYVYGTLYRIDGLYIGPSVNILSFSLPNGDWETPFVIEPSCNMCLIAGYDQVYQSMDQGNSWGPISPTFIPGRNISNIGLSAKDANVVYAVSSDTNIVNVSFDMGSSWNKLTADPGHISGIDVDPNDSSHIWVCYSGYGNYKVEEYKPSTGWKRLNSGLPNVPVNCIRIDTNTRILYIGTDVGVFYKSDTGTRWQLYNNGLPVVRVSQLNFKYAQKQLWASTFGRGMWVSPKADSVNKPNAVSNVNKSNNGILSPNPNNGNFTFAADIYYANKRADIRLTDIAGKTVWSETSRFDGSGKVQIKTQGLAKGVYFFEAAADNAVIAHSKVVME